MEDAKKKPPYATTIAVDFDGVIHGYNKGWHDGSIYDIPKPGVQKALQLFLHKGWEVVIFSTRNFDRIINGKMQLNQVNEMRKYLEVHQIPYTRIHVENGKPLCRLFIDDNALRFEDDWKDTTLKVFQLLTDTKGDE